MQYRFQSSIRNPKDCLRRLFAVPLTLMIMAGAPAARADNRLPPQLRNIGFDQKLNAQLPLEVGFRDENGRQVLLRDYFGKRPVILSFAYYGCTMLCPYTLDGLTQSMQGMPLEIGKQYEAVNISINPQEGPPLARETKDRYLRKYARPGAEEGWHFLTGDEVSIRKVTDAAGFRYSYDPVTRQYIHASGILVVTPGGVISKYLYGIRFSPLDLRLGVVEASSGKIGSPVDMLLLFCCKYDATTGRYTVLIGRVLALAALVTVLSLGTLLLILFRSERRPKRPVTAEHW